MKVVVKSMQNLLGALLVGSLGTLPKAEAMNPSAAMLLAQTETQESYWQASVTVLQEQINLLNRIERSLYSPQRSEVQGSHRRLFFYLGELDQYFAQYGDAPQTTCQNVQNATAKMEVYCGLWRSRNPLYSLLDVTRQRLIQLGGAEDSLLFPLANGALLPSDLTPQESWQAQPRNGSPVISNPPKPASNAGDIPLPAIAPLPNTVALIQQQKTNLLALQNQLPTGYLLEDFDVFATTNTRYQYQPTAQEYQLHQTFLAQANTGLSRLLPRDAYRETTTPSSLQPSLKERYPLPRLNEPQALPNLPLVIQDGELIFMPEAFNLGLITDLGEKDFNAVQHIDQNHPLLTYRSPQTFRTLREEQRRFLFQKSESDVSPTAPLSLNHLYLVRLIQYELAPEILEQKPLPRQRFYELKSLANPPSYDVLVAVKPVQNWLDGGYTLLWQIIDQKSAPQLTDLADYITVDSPIRP